jgi:hypothetical protein
MQCNECAVLILKIVPHPPPKLLQFPPPLVVP